MNSFTVTDPRTCIWYADALALDLMGASNGFPAIQRES